MDPHRDSADRDKKSRIQLKSVEMPELQFIDKVEDIPVTIQRQIESNVADYPGDCGNTSVQYTDSVAVVPVTREQHVLMNQKD